MEGKARTISNDVRQTKKKTRDEESALFYHVQPRDFFTLTDLLYRTGDQNFSLRTEPEKETIHFRANASIGFPLRDVESLSKNSAGQYVMMINFMGLSGSSSPLPGFYLDDMALKQAQEGGSATADFLNMFSHRWTQFIYHIWRKYRWHISFRNGGKDIISQRMLTLIGLGNPKIRERLNISHCRLLPYIGTLAGNARSPKIICDLISHCFDLSEVTLDNWQIRKIPIPQDQRNCLGVQGRDSDGVVTGKSVLGKNFTLGARVIDRSGKFKLCINGLSQERYLSLMPGGDEYLSLTTFVSFLLRDQLAWDLQLGLAPGEAHGMRLGDKKQSQLGRSCFIGKPPLKPFITISVRK